ncbi:M24 family metallopeptidase [Halovivax gelatinilyticus]|uniref:M24 family metallopeptidase n=1 Tax=Halovivax gelatinilyticus TaxID=2961597 RepID=UPI0020CA4B31|nr:Xaa-Pro peptidase family protein [Halovivax gelatinilyticus]
MATHYPQLTDHLDSNSVDGYLLDADGEDANQYYLSGYHAPDNFATLYADGAVHLLLSELEYTRAKSDSDGETVRKLSEFDYQETLETHGPETARQRVMAAFVRDYGVESVGVPESFPVGTADVLRDAGIDVVTDYADVIGTIRAVKTDDEVEHVRRTQRANEAAMDAAKSMLAAATVEDGVLHHDGDVLTSEAVRREIELTLLKRGCAMDNCIVACGAAAARAHDFGSGPLEPHIPIVIDIFPKDKSSGYCSDMTRAFVKGEPEAWVREWYDHTHDAYEAALGAIEAGVTGEAVHDAVCDVYEAAGFPTLRSDESTEDGFFHSTGHGVGLDVHEAPRLGQGGGELEDGHIVTVEPGLYEQGTGGVRIEDIVVVRDDGYENLTEYPTELTVL